MREFLGFPEKYITRKRLNKERFLNGANLTDLQKNKFDLYTHRIELLYDIRFSDRSEMIVLSAEFSIPHTHNLHFAEDYVKTIAQAFPYRCLIILQYKNYISFVLPDVRENAHTDRRMVVTDMYATSFMRMDASDSTMYVFLQCLRESIHKSKSSDELFLNWKHVFYDIFSETVEEALYSIQYEIFSIDHELHRERLFNNAISPEDDLLDDQILHQIEDERDTNYWALSYRDDDDVNDNNDDNCVQSYSTFYDGDYESENGDLDSIRDYDAQLFIKALKNYCWIIYESVNQDESDISAVYQNHEAWLSAYCKACNSYFHDVFSGGLTYKEYREIAVAFHEHVLPDNEDQSELDINEIIQRLE